MHPEDVATPRGSSLKGVNLSFEARVLEVIASLAVMAKIVLSGSLVQSATSLRFAVGTSASQAETTFSSFARASRMSFWSLWKRETLRSRSSKC